MATLIQEAKLYMIKRR